MSRPAWKGPFVLEGYLRAVGVRKVARPWLAHASFRWNPLRRSTVLPHLYQQLVLVHSGAHYVQVRLREPNFSLPLGEFSLTRVRCIFKRKKRKKEEARERAAKSKAAAKARGKK